jgi:pimeloyl-ACP methyl ester carboxylesterase
MKPTYHLLNHDGRKIAVYDTQKKNVPAIFFLHGNSLSAGVFENQFNDKELNAFRLIAIDLPGHGQSDKAANPAEGYSITGLTKTINFLIPEFKIEKIIAACFSLGGHIVMENKESPQIFKGVFASGYPPVSNMIEFGEAVLPNPAVPLLFKEELNEDEVTTIANELMKGSLHNDGIDIFSIIKQSDPAFRSSLIASVSNGLAADEKVIMKQFSNPLSLVHFENDAMTNVDYLKKIPVDHLWNHKLHILKGGSHCGFIDQSAAYNKLLYKYACSVF